jgi:flagellum-specific peptidoglycan hydrolase FlgJ
MLTNLQQQFLNEAIQAATQVQKSTGLLISGQVAQAAMESAWGSRAPKYNYFGIKQHTCVWTDGMQTIPTHEFKDGIMYLESLNFSTYVNMQACFQCHALILLHNFPTAYSATTTEGYIDSLMKDPITGLSYATDPSYKKLFMSIVATHNLGALDTQNKEASGSK